MKYLQFMTTGLFAAFICFSLKLTDCFAASGDLIHCHITQANYQSTGPLIPLSESDVYFDHSLAKAPLASSFATEQRVQLPVSFTGRDPEVKVYGYLIAGNGWIHFAQLEATDNNGRHWNRFEKNGQGISLSRVSSGFSDKVILDRIAEKVDRVVFSCDIENLRIRQIKELNKLSNAIFDHTVVKVN